MNQLLKLFLVIACLALFLGPDYVRAEVTVAEAAKSLPDKVGNFKAQGPASLPAQGFEETASEEAVISNAARTYTSGNNSFLVYLTRTRMDSAAYSLLTRLRRQDQEIKLREVGTASIAGPGGVFFFKGDSLVKVLPSETKGSDPSELLSLARSLAEQLDGRENDIPVLVKHLPDWPRVQSRVAYAVSLEALKRLYPNQPIIETVSFEGGAEAVVGNYDAATLVIIEFNTARIAGDNDWNIKSRINELRAAGAASPTAYRRVGNYGVFVFNGPSEQAANQLIDQVKYQQVVQWLGENPYAYENAQREFVETTLGVFVAVVKGSGLAFLTCFAIGGFFGALLFVRRRAQQRAVAAYSDAGGMVRLNLDEITPEADAGRLLGRGN